jgi:MFS transporter, DHA3 family, macrolide efflux protein
VFFLCLPLMITRSEGGRAGLGSYGLILSAYGCGNLAATVFLGGRMLPARPQFQMLGGNIQGGCGVLLLAAANFLPAEWRMAGFAAASALTAMGGPMQDIPTAVLRQTRVTPADRAAAMRAYMAMVGLGILIAMLLTPMAIAGFGIVPVIVGCGAVYLCVATLGLARLGKWREVQAG